MFRELIFIGIRNSSSSSKFLQSSEFQVSHHGKFFKVICTMIGSIFNDFKALFASNHHLKAHVAILPTRRVWAITHRWRSAREQCNGWHASSCASSDFIDPTK